MESIAIVALITPVVFVVARWGSRMCCFSIVKFAVVVGFVRPKSKSSSRCMNNYSLRIISAAVATITADIAAIILVVK